MLFLCLSIDGASVNFSNFFADKGIKCPKLKNKQKTKVLGTIPHPNEETITSSGTRPHTIAEKAMLDWWQNSLCIYRWVGDELLWVDTFLLFDNQLIVDVIHLDITDIIRILNLLLPG